MADLERYLNADPNTADPDFWEWYVQVYDREHKTLMNLIYNFIFYRRTMGLKSISFFSI